MGYGTLSIAQGHRLAVLLERQGALVKRTKNGYLVKNPATGGTAGYHLTNSDPRSVKNMRAQIRRIGYEWPFGEKRK